MSDVLGKVVVNNGRGVIQYKDPTLKDGYPSTGVPPFTIFFFKDATAVAPNDKVGCYKVYVPYGALANQAKWGADKFTQVISAYTKSGDWFTLPTNKKGTVGCSIYSPLLHSIRGYLSFEDDKPAEVQKGEIFWLEIGEVPEIPTVAQVRQGLNCPKALNAMQGNAIVVPKNISIGEPFQLDTTEDGVVLKNCYYMIDFLMKTIPDVKIKTTADAVLALVVSNEDAQIESFDSMNALQNVQQESYDKMIVPLYKFDEESNIEYDFRSIPTYYAWR